ncbi:MAG: protein kinase [Candidatus Aminicenantes bacterium]|nr:protein kinase [Candidatus Aminicenantes bacterium]
MKCPSCQSDNTPDSRFCSRCATPLLPDTPTPVSPGPFPTGEASEITKTMIASIDRLQRGQLFAGRYEIIEEVGRGGMGRVYKAFDRQIKEPVALKLLKPEIGFNEKAVERFKNELRYARRIAHPRVCRLYDLGESGLTHYLTMEFVEGEDLKAFIRRSDHLTTPKAVDIGRQVAEGLAEAHRLGVVHRDLKPQNVMIDREGQAKIMDFGLARFAESDGLTGSGLMLGTPEYMSPEQVDLKEVDARVDLYALGIILYEMVTGHVPFKGETPLAVAMKQKSERARDVRETNPLVPDSLIAVIRKCLEKDPRLRYQTAEEVVAGLNLVEQEFPSSAREISRMQVRGSSLLLRRRRRLKWMIAAPLVLAAVAVSVLMLSGKKNPFPVPSHDPKSGASSSESLKTNPVIDEAARASRVILGFLGSKEPQNLQEVERTLGDMEKYLPEKGPSVEAWNQARAKFSRARENPPSSGSVPEVQGEMQQLMALISERESAQKAKEAMAAAKHQVQARRGYENNFLYRVALFEERNADDAFAKNDYAGSRSLYRLLERIYQAAPKGDTAVRGLAALRDIVAALKAENQAVPVDRVDAWLSSSAAEIETQAETFAAAKDLENACAAYTRTAFLLQKIKDSAL